MNRNARLLIVLLLLGTGVLGVLRSGASAQPAEPQPVDLPCAENVSAQVLGRGEPANAEGQALLLVRTFFAPGGSIGPHTHPGTLVLTVESGTFGFTLLDEGEMTIHRAAGEDSTPAAEVTARTGEEVELTAGDWFVETGMVHTGRSIGDETAVTVYAGLVEAGGPATQCVDDPSA